MKQILQQIRQQAVLRPQAMAVRSGDTAINYVELVADIDKVSRRLQQLEINRLGLSLDNSIDWIVIDLACVVAGVTVVPLPWFFSSEQINHAISEAEVDTIVSNDTSLATTAGIAYCTGIYNNTLLFKRLTGIEKCRNSEISKISFTSGTTGTPKGIGLGASLIGDVCCSVLAMTSELPIQRHLSLLPYSTLLENICGIYLPLMTGKTVFAEPAERLGLSASLNISPSSLAQVLLTTRTQSLMVTPQLLKLLCGLVEKGLYDPVDLIFVAVGGGHVGTPLIERAYANAIPVYEGYGLTEFASVTTLNTPSQCRHGSVGKVLPHVSMEIASDGEILLRRKNQQSDFVYTGDLGRVDDDGFVYISGRKKNTLVLSTGRNISPEWVEAELQAIPFISQCLVFGDGDSTLSAAIVCQQDMSSEALCSAITQVNQRLPAYACIALVHRLSEPFSVDSNLLTETGKPRRGNILRCLPELLETAETISLSNFGQSLSIPQLKETILC